MVMIVTGVVTVVMEVVVTVTVEAVLVVVVMETKVRQEAGCAQLP